MTSAIGKILSLEPRRALNQFDVVSANATVADRPRFVLDNVAIARLFVFGFRRVKKNRKNAVGRLDEAETPAAAKYGYLAAHGSSLPELTAGTGSSLPSLRSLASISARCSADGRRHSFR
jgi:hypothetical protein